MSGTLWEVVGTGSGAGGIIVRTQKDVNSREAPGGRLQAGALIAELERWEDRLRFTKIAGVGPDDGWVSIQAKGIPLVSRVGQESDPSNASNKEPPASIPTRQPTPKIWLLGQGTRGDVQPLVVLGQALMKKGWKVRLFASKNFRNFVESYGLEYSAQGVDIQARTKEIQEEKTAERSEMEERYKTDKEAMGGEMINMVLTNEVYTEIARSFAQALQAERPDVILFANLIGMIPLYAWRKYGIPVMHANYFPVWLNTEEALRQETFAEFMRIDNIVHEATGFGALQGVSYEDWHAWYTNHSRSMTAHSKELLQLAYGELAKVGEAHQDMFTGFWIIDEAASMVDLESFGGIEGLRAMHRFFECGPPPIYIGWGSMPIGAGILAKALLCIKEAGQRALVVGGWMGTGLRGLEEFIEETTPGDPFEVIKFARKNVLFVKSAPHGWLFPRCAATIHHGGAGTTAAALLAGKPTIITPFSFDQQHHADWVEKLGCGAQLSLAAGGGFLDIRWVNVMKKAATDEKMRKRAREIAASIGAETGVHDAVARIEAVLADSTANGNKKTGSFGV